MATNVPPGGLVGVVKAATAPKAQAAPAAGGDLYGRTSTISKSGFSTKGSKIINNDTGGQVKLDSVALLGLGIAGYSWGNWIQSKEQILDAIKAAGFNSLRVPISVELMTEPGPPKGDNAQGNLALHNPEGVGLTSIELLDGLIAAASERGLGIIVDIHKIKNQDWQTDVWWQGTDGPHGKSSQVFNGLNDPSNKYTGSVNEEDVIRVWQEIAKRYADNPGVIGYDLYNEPHGKATWGDGGDTDWRRAAEAMGGAIQAIDPSKLIVVEGIGDTKGNGTAWWGGNLNGVAANPVRLNNVVYSPHDYSSDVAGNGWLDKPAAQRELWERNWGYIARDNIAPIWVGEFGAKNWSTEVGTGRDMMQFLDYINEIGAGSSMWAWQAGASGDSGGYASDDSVPIPQKVATMTKFFGMPEGFGSGTESHPSGFIPDYNKDAKYPDNAGFTPAPYSGYKPVTPGVGANPPVASPPPPQKPSEPQPSPQPGISAPITEPGKPAEPQEWGPPMSGPNDPDPVHKQVYEERKKAAAVAPKPGEPAPTPSPTPAPAPTTPVTPAPKPATPAPTTPSTPVTPAPGGQKPSTTAPVTPAPKPGQQPTTPSGTSPTAPVAGTTIDELIDFWAKIMTGKGVKGGPMAPKPGAPKPFKDVAGGYIPYPSGPKWFNMGKNNKPSFFPQTGGAAPANSGPLSPSEEEELSQLQQFFGQGR